MLLAWVYGKPPSSKISLASFKPVSKWNTAHVWFRVHLNNQSLGVITLKGHTLSKYWPCENVTLRHSCWDNNLLLHLLFYCHCSWASLRSSTSLNTICFIASIGKKPQPKKSVWLLSVLLPKPAIFNCRPTAVFLRESWGAVVPLTTAQRSGRSASPFGCWTLSLLQEPPHFTAGRDHQPLLSLD